MGFFLVHLAGRSADSYVAPPAAAAGASPFALPDVPKGALQVTATGQVATSYPGSETVYSLNLKRAKEKLPVLPVQTLLQVQTDVREVTGAEAVPGNFAKARIAGGSDPYRDTTRPFTEVGLDHSLTDDSDGTSEIFGEYVTLHEKDGFDLAAIQIGHESKAVFPKGMLLLVPDLGITAPNGPPSHALLARMLQFAHQGYNVVAITPRPSPPGGEETKAAILGPFYLTELRAELVGKTTSGDAGGRCNRCDGLSLL